MQYGMNVKINFTKQSIFRGEKTTLHNVTEVHYNYLSLDKDRVAFESDIQGTGCTYHIADIAEFEVAPATKKHNAF